MDDESVRTAHDIADRARSVAVRIQRFQERRDAFSPALRDAFDRAEAATRAALKIIEDLEARSSSGPTG